MNVKLAQGSFVSAENQIDSTTGTLVCKAAVRPIADALLFPNQFVNVRIHIEPVQPATTATSGQR
jgi:multidrug efflux system membrane fusion protein